MKISEAGLARNQAVRLAIRKVSVCRFLEYVRANPSASVHDVCRDLLAGLDVKDYEPTQRAYAAVYSRIWRARRLLGIPAPGRRGRGGSFVRGTSLPPPEDDPSIGQPEP